MIEQPRKSGPLPRIPSTEEAQPSAPTDRDVKPTDRDVKNPSSEKADAEKRIERFRER